MPTTCTTVTVAGCVAAPVVARVVARVAAPRVAGCASAGGGGASCAAHASDKRMRLPQRSEPRLVMRASECTRKNLRRQFLTFPRRANHALITLAQGLLVRCA